MKLGRLVRQVTLVAGLLALLLMPAQAPVALVGKLAAASAPKAARTTSPSADFNGDGFADLAIGVSGEDVGSIVDAGAVEVLYGSPEGLAPVGDQFWTQDSRAMTDAAETGDTFGSALAAGDFSGNGAVALAIGVPWEDVKGIGNAGAVNVFYGAVGGRDAANNQLWNQYPPRVKDEAEPDDLFGFSLPSR